MGRLDDSTLQRITQLHPAIREEVERIYRSEVLPALSGRASFRIASTLRTWEEQADIYAQGRTKSGSRVTNAKPGESWHNYGLAFDIVLADVPGNAYNTTSDFDDDAKADWMEAIEIFKKYGYSWGGDWRGFKDTPHLEKTFGIKLKEAEKRYLGGDFIPGTKYIRIDGARTSYTQPPPAAKTTAVIGDDVGLALGNKYPDRIDVIADYCKAGWGVDELENALKGAPKKDYTKVVLSIGAKDKWEKTGNAFTNVFGDPRKDLIRRITDAFPKAELYILNGYFGTGSLAPNSECDQACWTNKVKAYTLYFEGSKFKTIGQVKNFNLNAWTNDELIAGYVEDLNKYSILSDVAPTPSAAGGEAPGVGQPTSRGEYSGESGSPTPTSQKNQLSSDGIVNLFQPTIVPTTIRIETPNDEIQKKEFIRGLGYSPIVYYNAMQVDYDDIQYFSIYYDGLLPHINIFFNDSLGLLKDKATPIDNSKITVFISSRNDSLRPIHIDFKVKTYVNESGFMNIVAALDVNGLYYSTYKSYPGFTSNFLLQQICRDVGLGFNTNIVETNDTMTWMSTGERVYDFMQDVLDHAYISDESFISGNIDLYYCLNFVDVQKELARNTDGDLGMADEALQKVKDKKESGEKSNMLLTNDYSMNMSSNYFSAYRITNRATDISLEEGYGDNIVYYDTVGKSEANFSVDSMNLNADKSMVLKSPNDDEFFQANRNFVYAGKSNPDNSHVNYNYSSTHNERNILEADKLLMELEIPSPNFNLYKFQKIKVVFSHQAKSYSAEMVNSRYTGDWMIADIRYVMNKGTFGQVVTLVKRELELSEEEVNAGMVAKSRPTGRGYDNYRGNYDNPPAGTGGGSGAGGGNEAPGDQNVTSDEFDAILIGGLDTRPDDKNIDQQVELLKQGFGASKNLKGFRFNADNSVIEQTLANSTNALIFMFSAGCAKAKVISEMAYVNKNNVIIIEPYASSSNVVEIINAAIKNGVPAKNVYYGPGSARGEGIPGSTSSNAKSHWDALTSVGRIYVGVGGGTGRNRGPANNVGGYKTAYPELPFTDPRPPSDEMSFKFAVDYLKSKYSSDVAKAVFAVLYAEAAKNEARTGFYSAGGHNYAGVQTDNARWGAPGIVGQYSRVDSGGYRRSFAIFTNDQAFLDFMANRIKSKGFDGDDADAWTMVYINKWWSPAEKASYTKGTKTYNGKLSIFNSAINRYDNLA